MRNYMSNDESLVSLAHIDERKDKGVFRLGTEREKGNSKIGAFRCSSWQNTEIDKVLQVEKTLRC